MIEATQVTSAHGASAAMGPAGTKKMDDGAKRRDKKRAASPGMDSDDITMQLPNETRMLEGQGMAVRLTPVFAGVDSAEMTRILLPIEPVEIVDTRGMPGSVAAAAMLDIAYQLR
jgi:hypothetical protein